MIETSWGKIVTIHEPGDMFLCASPGCEANEIDLRDHKDGIDCGGVTKDNIAFYMKVDVVFKPKRDEIIKYIELFGAENDKGERDARRWNVLQQHVMNACRNATSGKYDAYQVRAQQSAILADMQTELTTKLAAEMAIHLSSVGMEIQPQFNDRRIDHAANAVVAAQKTKEAEQQYKEAAQIKLEREQIQNQIYSQTPQAFEIRKLEIQKDIAQAWSQHQGPLVFGGGGLQIQVPGGK